MLGYRSSVQGWPVNKGLDGAWIQRRCRLSIIERILKALMECVLLADLFHFIVEMS
jgi:hypothetical protein